MSRSKNNLSPPPPKWVDKLLQWFCAPHLLEEVIGDLHERYYLRLQKVGEKKARTLYFREVLAYMRPPIIKRKSYKYSSTSFVARICYRTISKLLTGI